MKKEFNFDNRKYVLSYDIVDGEYNIRLDFIGYVESMFKITTLDGSVPILNSYDTYQIEVDDKNYFISKIDEILYLIDDNVDVIVPVKIYECGGFNFHLSTDNKGNIFNLFLTIPNDEKDFEDVYMEIIYSIGKGIVYKIIKDEDVFRLFDFVGNELEVSEKIFHIKDDIFIVRDDDNDFCTVYKKSEEYETLFHYNEIKYLCNDKFICKSYNQYGIVDMMNNIIVCFIYDKIEVVDDKLQLIKIEELELNNI